MALFEEVTLEWKGEKYIIAHDRVMGAIGLVEEIVTQPELAVEIRTGNYRLKRIADAYSSLLRYAGARNVTAEDVYGALYGVGVEQKLLSYAPVMALLAMMIPPAVVKKAAPATEAGASEGKPEKAS